MSPVLDSPSGLAGPWADVLIGLLTVVLAGIVVPLATRWVARHPDRVGATLAGVGQRPAVARVRSRYQRQWRFVGRRLSPGQTTGLILTVGIGVVVALGTVFAQLLDNVLDGDGIAVVDRPVMGWLAAHREPWLTTLVQLVTHVGSPLGAATLATVVGVALVVARWSWLPLAVSAVGAAGIGAINLAIKAVVGRGRPPLALAVTREGGFSFPSGHATGTTVVWLLSVWMVSRWVIRRWAAQVALWTAAVVVIGAVGLSRVYLGVHYPSDVLGSWTLGAGWATAVAVATAMWERSRAASGHGAAELVGEGVDVGG